MTDSNKTAIATQNAPAAVGPYSQGMVANGMIFTAGQLGIDPATGKLEGDVQQQTRQALLNVQAVLQAGGSDLSKVLKTTVFMQDLNDFAAMNTIYQEVFAAAGGAYPARSTFQVAKLPLGGLVEIEAIALA